VTASLVRNRLLLWATAYAAAAIVGLPPWNAPLHGPAAVAAGAAIGTVVFLALAGRPRRPRGRPRVALARSAWLAAGAAFEELLWHGLALALLLPRLGVLGALGATSAGFAFAHRHQGRGGGVHLVTGGVFGAAFVCAGLAAAIAAHASYNVLVDLGVLAEREPG
jgi:membrane protease YdiL (CAAX protease family)